MTKLLDKEVVGIKEKYRISDTTFSIDTVCEINEADMDEFLLELRQSLTRYARAVVEEAMPEEENPMKYMSRFYKDKAEGFNECLTKFDRNVERLLGSKEDK